ncbi:MAG: hypothetical protein IJ774_07565 [Selenomonadaceae bacterium]|nr:hypothetical protein [Selenomonadaceae bacterium]MBR1806226.1 hypothetical protein [Selenomonadaceae bacterium]
MARPRIAPADKRSERTTLLMTPREYDGVAVLAELTGKTVNDFVCSILAAIVDENSAVIERHKADRKKNAADVNLSVSVTVSSANS